MRPQDFIKVVPGEIRDTRGNYTNVLTELGFTESAVNLTKPNDGYNEIGSTVLMVNGSAYELKDIIRNIATLDKSMDIVTSTHASSVAITDAMVGTPLKVKAESIITQADAGTQTFAAPKAITGNASITVTNTIGATPYTYTLTPSATLYGLAAAPDNIQFNTGLVTRQTKHIILNGTETWTSGAAGVAPYVLTLSDKAVGTANFACSHSVPAASGTTAETCVGAAAAKTITFYPNTGAAYNTLTKWKALLLAASTGANPVQLVYEIADTTEQLLPTQILARTGTNTITHNAEGSVTVNYYRSLSGLGVGSWSAWTPELTWTTGTPASLTTVARYMKINKTVFFNFYCSSADANGATALTISLPVAPKDNNSFIPVNSLQLQNATWSNPFGYIDDEASVIAFYKLTTGTDAQAIKVIVSGQYEVA